MVLFQRFLFEQVQWSIECRILTFRLNHRLCFQFWIVDTLHWISPCCFVLITLMLISVERRRSKVAWFLADSHREMHSPLVRAFLQLSMWFRYTIYSRHPDSVLSIIIREELSEAAMPPNLSAAVEIVSMPDFSKLPNSSFVHL